MFNYALGPRTERAPLVRGSSVTDGVKCGTQPTHISLYTTVNVLPSCQVFKVILVQLLELYPFRFSLSRESTPLTS